MEYLKLETLNNSYLKSKKRKRFKTKKRKMRLTKNEKKTLKMLLENAKISDSTLSISIAKLTSEGLEKGEKEIEQKLLETPHVIQLYKMPSRGTTYLILFGFRNMEELDSFFSSTKKKNELHKFTENKELFIFSHNNLIKNSSSQLFNKVIDEFGGRTEKN
jgi:DNA-binding Lrp family transcriptional regulator